MTERFSELSGACPQLERSATFVPGVNPRKIAGMHLETRLQAAGLASGIYTIRDRQQPSGAGLELSHDDEVRR